MEIKIVGAVERVVVKVERLWSGGCLVGIDGFIDRPHKGPLA
jgi:hypothetical protein